MEFHPLQQGAEFDPLAQVTDEQSRAASVPVFFGEGYMVDFQAAVERERPDVVLIDCFLVSAQTAAERMGLSYAILVHTVPAWFLSFWDTVLLGPTNALRQRSGLPAVATTAALWGRAARALVASTPLLDGSARDRGTLPNVRYVGPILEPDSEHDAFDPGQDGATPLVLVSFSTTSMGQQDTIARVIEVLRGMPVRGIVTTGPAVDGAAVASAPNVSVHGWIRHAAVLPHASLVITHGGHSTVIKALAHGVPLLCLPLGRDQGFIAQRVQDIGAGLTIPPDAAPDAIIGAMTALLDDPTYRAAAREVSATIRASGPGERNAADELEHLARALA
jgi:MGT family glycosyltransferase